VREPAAKIGESAAVIFRRPISGRFPVRRRGARLIEGEKTLLVAKSSCRTNRFQVEPQAFSRPGPQQNDKVFTEIMPGRISGLSLNPLDFNP
jgi:hypothetical protein